MKVKTCLLLLSLPLLFSCKKAAEEGEKVDEARILFTQSASLILDFTQQFKNATDSAQMDSLSDLFDKRMVDLNFKFPPNTDLKLTEQENDSLFNLLQDLKSVKDNKWKKINVVEPDTIPESQPKE